MKTKNEIKKITTLAQLKKTKWESLPVKEELRRNLIDKIKKKEKLFPDIYGLEDTVEVELVNALLARHNFILLGLRGQGKTKLIRLLKELLSPYSPVLAGTELNEDPYHPISPLGRSIIEKEGDKAKIKWLSRDERYNEKLATPDVSVSDLIGDLDPIRAAREKLDISNPEVIHWGIIPRSNRGIFAINELPDLQPRIQVSLFNILEENDIQVKGFPLRIPLDILLVFTANPEDYTNRGRIITPLKDRINSQIITHYPSDIKTSKTITLSQANPSLLKNIQYPDTWLDIIENITFVARSSHLIDKFSGVSQRLSISALENAVANMERRCLQIDEKPVARLMDIYATVPAITGKVELIEERGEKELIKIATSFINEAIENQFRQYFPMVFERNKDGEEEPRLPYESIIYFFKEGGEVVVDDQVKQKEYEASLNKVAGLKKLVQKYAPENQLAFFMELVLETLCYYKVIQRKVENGAVIFNDLYSSMFKK